MEHEIPLIISSDPANGASNLSPGGDRFEIILPRPIKIPKEAKKATVEVNSASVWNSVYNISAKQGNNEFVYIEGTPVAEAPYAAVQVYTVTIDDGLYDLDLLATAINRSLISQGLDSGVIKFIGDDATQKVIIEFTKADQQIDFTGANSCRELLGFEAQLYPPLPTTGAGYVVGDNVANFNKIDYYLLATDLAGYGIGIGGSYRSIVAKMLITSPIGSQTVYQPVNPPRIPIYSQIGEEITRLNCWITDQRGQSLELADYWSMDLIIRYSL